MSTNTGMVFTISPARIPNDAATITLPVNGTTRKKIAAKASFAVIRLPGAIGRVIQNASRPTSGSS